MNALRWIGALVVVLLLLALFLAARLWMRGIGW